ncbi:MAG: acyltransferase domain-containing protein [Myxococcota bacterium]
MGLALAAHAEVAAVLDRCAAVLDPRLGRPLREVLADGEALQHTANAQPALLAVELAVASWLRALGVAPVAVAGHSLGEIAAAAHAGVWSVEDAAVLAFERGRLMEAHGRAGTMAAVAADADVVPGRRWWTAPRSPPSTQRTRP